MAASIIAFCNAESCSVPGFGTCHQCGAAPRNNRETDRSHRMEIVRGAVRVTTSARSNRWFEGGQLRPPFVAPVVLSTMDDEVRIQRAQPRDDEVPEEGELAGLLDSAVSHPRPDARDPSWLPSSLIGTPSLVLVSGRPRVWPDCVPWCKRSRDPLRCSDYAVRCAVKSSTSVSVAAAIVVGAGGVSWAMDPSAR